MKKSLFITDSNISDSVDGKKMKDGELIGIIHEVQPLTEGPWELLSFEPIELARQLTLIDQKYFKMIEPREFIDSNWTKKEKLELSPNICKLAQWTSNASLWMASEILSVTDITKRTLTLAQIIQIASVNISKN